MANYLRMTYAKEQSGPYSWFPDAWTKRKEEGEGEGASVAQLLVYWLEIRSDPSTRNDRPSQTTLSDGGPQSGDHPAVYVECKPNPSPNIAAVYAIAQQIASPPWVLQEPFSRGFEPRHQRPGMAGGHTQDK
ncbi:hypothetical protein PoB_005756900 [Plakobranchus ocellatus]|uniref:Uncharacterized protein n=1 Tax=Plakobranchus ocellatus TaxID=259542 RepID=A0AAV4CJM8_9GAST|nr:hypothetical protein PoB_005756900 [Plakobranchus ocellatus]